MAPATDINTAKNRRQRLHDRVQRCLELANEMKTDPSVRTDFMTRASRLRNSLSEFEALVEDCYRLEHEENPQIQMDPYTEMIELFEASYFDIMGAYDETNRRVAEANTSSLNASAQQLSVKLPEIELDKFDGTLTAWPEFRDNFEAMIVSNEQLKPSAKLVYLKRSLVGPALVVIRELHSLTLNFDIAWQALKDRYDNERMLGTELVGKLLNFAPIRRESETELARFLSVFGECFASLRQLSIVQLDDFILLHVALRTLPTGMQKAFERTVNPKVMPSMSDLNKFVQAQLRVLTIVSPAHGASTSQTDNAHKPNSGRALVTYSEVPTDRNFGSSNGQGKGNGSRPQSSPDWSHSNGKSKSTTGQRVKGRTKLLTCYGCGQRHRLKDCPEYANKDVRHKREMIISLKLCENCLYPGHSASSCGSIYRCQVCNQAHHTSIHEDTVEPKKHVSHCSLPVNRKSSQEPTIMLATATVRLKSSRGTILVRALLDSAAQGTYITTDCARKLKLHVEQPRRYVSGLAKNPVQVRNEAYLDLTTKTGMIIAKGHKVELLDQITGRMPSAKVSPTIREKLKGLQLADPEFDIPGPIDILIGAELYGTLFTGQKRALGDGFPTAFSTMMGFVILGNAPIAEDVTKSNKNLLITTKDQELQVALQRFWQLEEPLPQVKPPKEEDPAELHFRETTERTPEGRFKVRLPFKDSPELLGESEPQARRRFKGLEGSFRKKPGYRQDYVALMRDHERAGILKLAEPGVTKRPHFFLPHHGILKPGSTTSRLRIVYDASAKSRSNYSLNDLLYVGPQLMCDIREILLRFRFHKYILVCDIRRMYLQLQLHEEDQPYHLILWRESEHQPIKTYQLTSVTFGVGSSAFQAQRALRQLAYENKDEFKSAAEAILEDTYVDNITTGGPTITAALERKTQLEQLLERGKFELRKYISNAPELLEGLPVDHLESPVTWDDQQTSAFPIMGLHWLPQDDAFSYTVKIVLKPPTKRGVTSTVASVFDPLGIVTPVIFWAKCFIQELWIRKVDWDSELPPEALEPWNKFLQELPLLSRIRLPRFLGDPGTAVQIHAFGDASFRGYANCVYMRTETVEGEVDISLINAKSKVAPLKRVTIPRLELCAAVLLTTNLKTLLDELERKYKIEDVFAWSDSTTALQWLEMPSYKLQTFVANRVEYIQETLPNVRWKYTDSESNPADCASRGLFASEIIDHPLWWKGPPWLRLPMSEWPAQKHVSASSELPELRHVCTVIQNPDTFDMLFGRVSSWSKIQRVLAYAFRHLHNRLYPNDRRAGGLLTVEFQRAERFLIRRIQYTVFRKDVDSMQRGELCSLRIQRLTPFLDQDGLVRVGGRLTFADIPENQKHPLILPAKHPLVLSLIREWHLRYLHAGPQLLQSILYKRYWILAGRSAIRAVVHACVPCFRAKPTNTVPMMGNLPSPRVTMSRPFSSTGCDYAGPFKVKVHGIRFAKIVPAYVCLFVCMSTKSVHVEVTEDLTTPAFLAAVTRMASRRGAPRDIYSDCGSNLTGASNEIKRLTAKIKSELPTNPEATQLTQDCGLNFHFSSPAAPHQGGHWESMVKQLKKHLVRVTQRETLTMEEFRTLTVRVEAMLNSRPIAPESNDPSDLRALTPAHFLIGEPMTAIPEQEHPEDKLPLKRWHRVQAMSQGIWRRWSSEYLQTLTPKGKWTRDCEPVKLNDLVLIHEPNVPPLRWRMGRIVALHPGRDGRTRVVTLKTANGELKRPVVKVYPLPTPSN